MRKSFAALILLASTAAVQAEVAIGPTESVIVKPGSAIHWRTPTSFKVIEVGNPEAVEAHPGVITERDMIVVAKPLKDGTLSNSANVLVMDANGDLVGTLRVEITASGQPLNFVTILSGTKQIFWDCSNACVEVDVTNKPTPDAVTITSRAPDGSLVTRQYGPTKPAPGEP
jgi:hypothetical protein